LFKISATQQTHGGNQAARGIARLFMKTFVRIQFVVAGRVRFIIADITFY
jgi:hypothetical protein